MSAVPENSIAALYAQWLAVRRMPDQDMTDAELDARYARYSGLQNAIVASTPVTAADFAMMYMADSNHGDSDNSDGFRDKLAAIAETGGGA